MRSTFFTKASKSGSVGYGQLPTEIVVFQARDNPVAVGIATEVGRIEHEMAVWSLRVRQVHVPGRFVINDGYFVRVENIRP
jgi:hypothetical protein